MVCGKCGSTVRKTDKFCKKCGETLSVNISTKKEEINISNNKPKLTTLAIVGFIFGIITMITTRVTYFLIGIDDFVNEDNIIIYVILGIIIGILVIVGLIISLVDYLKTRNVFSIMGVLFNGLALLYGILIIIGIIAIILE